MDRKKIQSILQDALEDEISSSQINLLPHVKERLVAGTSQQGEKMNRTNSRRLTRIALATLAVVALLAVAFVTPPGRAFAQSVLQFFRRAQSNVLPLPTAQIVSPEVSQGDVTAVPPSPMMSIADAERVAGFDVQELPTTPDGFEYLGAMAVNNSISIQYEARGGGGALVINESPNGFVQSDWDQAPAEAISQVMIGDLEAEIVQGVYVVYPNDPASAHWNSDVPVLRLRWIKDGIWFEMAKFGGVEAVAYLDQDALIGLAESITNDPFPLSIKDVEVEAGFDVLEPSILPDGLTFLGAALDPALKMTSLSIGYSKSERIILIKQQPVESPETCMLCGLVGASASVQQVQINDAPGEYAEGVWELTDNGPVWRDDPYLKTMRWQKDGMAFELIYMGTDLDKDNLVTVAESMK